jgi:hypothetical protein
VTDDTKGYFYMPKTISDKPIEPIIIDPASFNPRKGIITKYGKKLLEEGAKYYSKISIKELIDESESKKDSGGGDNPQVSD